MKVIGIRYRLPLFGLLGEMYTDGNTILRCGEAYIQFDQDDHLVRCNKDGAALCTLLDESTTRRFILRHGRPYGTIWS
jgi:hypothetical protein